MISDEELERLFLSRCRANPEDNEPRIISVNMSCYALRKFAQLVAEEARKKCLEYANILIEKGQSDYGFIAFNCAADIRDHFGIKGE